MVLKDVKIFHLLHNHSYRYPIALLCCLLLAGYEIPTIYLVKARKPDGKFTYKVHSSLIIPLPSYCLHTFGTCPYIEYACRYKYRHQNAACEK